MPIAIISNIEPANNGLFPTHISTFGKGGWHEVQTLADRDNIPIERRSPGMACSVIDIGLVFILGTDLSTWEEIVLTGVEDAPITGEAYVRINASWAVLGVYFDDGIYA